MSKVVFRQLSISKVSSKYHSPEIPAESINQQRDMGTQMVQNSGPTDSSELASSYDSEAAAIFDAPKAVPAPTVDPEHEEEELESDSSADLESSSSWDGGLLSSPNSESLTSRSESLSNMNPKSHKRGEEL